MIPKMKLGDGVGIWLMLLWLAVSVGPWWYALGIVAIGLVLNVIEDRR